MYVTHGHLDELGLTAGPRDLHLKVVHTCTGGETKCSPAWYYMPLSSNRFCYSLSEFCHCPSCSYILRVATSPADWVLAHAPYRLSGSPIIL